MDTLDLARLQFAGTVAIHWSFVLLTLGVVPLVAGMHTAAVLARDAERRETLERMTRFWGQLYVINYALGIVTGLVMEFQFGLSWTGLSKFAGNVFGAPLALETLVAFFAESTFLGMWIFGWGRLRPAVHAALIWLVALTAYASAYWILVANGFMQSPVGYEVRDGVAYLTDFGALLTNDNAVIAFGHVSVAALLTGGLFLAGVSAAHFARGTTEREFFRRSLRLGLLVAALAAFPVYKIGSEQYPVLGRTQPMKLAMLDGKGVDALQAQMAKQHGPGDYVPPSWAGHAQDVMLYVGYTAALVALCGVVVAFREPLLRVLRVRRVPVLAVLAVPLIGVMVAKFVGAFLYEEPGPNQGPITLLSILVITALLIWGRRLADLRWPGWALVAAVPLPFVASVGGWAFREGGRQPWIVYGQLTISKAVTPLSTPMMAVSCAAFLLVFAALAVVDWTLIVRFARRGPDGAQLGAGPVLPLAVEEPLPSY